jgi:hypothetical protein
MAAEPRIIDHRVPGAGRPGQQEPLDGVGLGEGETDSHQAAAAAGYQGHRPVGQG